MRNIPVDIIETAASICASVGITDSHARKVFAAAILVERQRCADIVLNTTSGKGRTIPSRLEDNPLALAILA